MRRSLEGHLRKPALAQTGQQGKGFKPLTGLRLCREEPSGPVGSLGLSPANSGTRSAAWHPALAPPSSHRGSENSISPVRVT